MKNTDKPARMMTKITEALRKRDAELAACELKREQEEVESVRLFGAMLDLSKKYTAAEARISELVDFIDKLDANWDAVVEALGLPPGGDSRETVCDCIAIHRENSHKLALLAPQVALVDEQQAALVHVLDKVRDRMRKKELEEERAILNRKALTAAVPKKAIR